MTIFGKRYAIVKHVCEHFLTEEGVINLKKLQWSFSSAVQEIHVGKHVASQCLMSFGCLMSCQVFCVIWSSIRTPSALFEVAAISTS